MSAAEIEGNPFTRPDISTGDVASITPITHPRIAGGVLLPDFMVHHTTVVDVQPFREPEKHAGIGTFFSDLYTMSDDTAYEVVEGIPERQRTGIPVDATTAWWTQAWGHNNLTDLELVRMGFRTRRIGPEQFPDIEGFNIFNPFALYAAIQKGWSVNLGYTAHNMNEILEVSDEIHHYEIEPGVSFTTGESRGPMTEPGFNLLGSLRDKPRHVAYADSIDPCVAEKISGLQPLRLIKVVLSEAEAMGRTAVHVLRSPDRREYVRTIDVSPELLIPALTNVHALLNGQTGEMAELRPKDSPMHLSFMRRSYGNDHEKFEEIYKSHPLVHFANRGGAHLDIPRTRRGVVRRFGHIIDQLQQNDDNPDAIDFEKVYAPPKNERRARSGFRVAA